MTDSNAGQSNFSVIASQRMEVYWCDQLIIVLINLLPNVDLGNGVAKIFDKWYKTENRICSKCQLKWLCDMGVEKFQFRFRSCFLCPDSEYAEKTFSSDVVKFFSRFKDGAGNDSGEFGKALNKGMIKWIQVVKNPVRIASIGNHTASAISAQKIEDKGLKSPAAPQVVGSILPSTTTNVEAIIFRNQPPKEHESKLGLSTRIIPASPKPIPAPKPAPYPSDRDFPPLAPSALKPATQTLEKPETKTEKAKTWSRQPLYFMRIEGSYEEKIEIGRVSIKEAVNITRTRQEKEECDVHLFKQNKHGEVFEISWKNYLSDKKPIYIQSASGQRRNKKISATQHGTPGIPYFFLEWPEGNEGPAQKTTAEAIDWAWEKAYYLENEVGVRLYKFRKSDSKKTEINWHKKKSALLKVRQEDSPPPVDLIDDRKQETELFAPASLPPVLNDEREVDIDLRPVISVPAKKTEKTQFNFKLNLAPLQIRISGKFDFTVSLVRTED